MASPTIGQSSESSDDPSADAPQVAQPDCMAGADRKDGSSFPGSVPVTQLGFRGRASTLTSSASFVVSDWLRINLSTCARSKAS